MSEFELDASRLCQTAERLKAERSSLEASWTELSNLILPGRFVRKGSEQLAGKRDSLDSTAALAAESLATALCGLANPARVWFEPVARDAALAAQPEIADWFQTVGNLMRAELTRQSSRFYVEALNLIKEMVAFGTGIFFSEEIGLTGTFNFTTRPLADTCFDKNASGQIDKAFYSFSYTASQCVEKWGAKAPQNAHKAVKEGQPQTRVEILHAVVPSKKIKGARGAAFASMYIDIESKTLISKGLYHEFPYQVPRWSSVPLHVYGFSPAMMALPDIKFLNALVKTNLIAAQKAVDPPLLAVNENGLRGLKTHPGSIIYGGLDASGRRMYEPLMTGQTSLGLGDQEGQKREQIKEAFFHSLLFSTLQSQMTATEFLGRYEEKARLMAPHLAAIQSEFLSPFLHRLYGLMSRAGKLPEAPKALQQLGEKNELIEVTFVSPLSRIQQSEDASIGLKLLAGFAPYLGENQMALMQIDSAKMIRDLAVAVGLPLKEVIPEEIQQEVDV